MTSAVEQAKSLLDLVATPSALVTGTFLAFAGRAIRENEVHVNHARIIFATLAAIAAICLTTSLAILMAPLAVRSVVSYRGPVEATLVVYWMILLSVLGTLAFSIWTAVRCLRELRRPVN